MKAIEWVRYLSDQRERYSKNLFTVTELANVADASPAVINVELGRLVKQGVIRRWVPGRYGLPKGVTADALAAAIDSDAYVTGAYALAYHGFITQELQEIACFTRRRHNRSRTRPGPLGTLVFVTVSPRVYALPAEGRMAGPEQALCDLFYGLRRRALDPESLYTFRKLDQLHFTKDLLARYPQTVQQAVSELVKRSWRESRR